MKVDFTVSNNYLKEGNSAIITLIMYNDENDYVIIEEIRGLHNPYIEAKFAEKPAKILAPGDHWNYYIEVIPRRIGEVLLQLEIVYRIGDKTFIYPVGTCKLVIGPGEGFEYPKVDFRINPSEVEYAPGEEIELYITIRNLSATKKYVLERIEGILPQGFVIIKNPQGFTPVERGLKLNTYELHPNENLSFSITIAQRGAIQKTRLELFPQLFLRQENGDLRIINGNKFELKLRQDILFANIYMVEDRTIIVLPATISKILNLKEGKIGIIPSSNGFYALQKTPIDIIQDPIEQLKIKSIQLAKQKEELIQMVTTGKISKKDYEKYLEIIKKEIEEINIRISQVMSKINKPEVALRFIGNTPTTIEEIYEMEKLQETTEIEKLILNTIKKIINRKQELIKYKQKINEIKKTKTIPSKELDELLERIETELSDLSSILNNIRNLLKANQ